MGSEKIRKTEPTSAYVNAGGRGTRLIGEVAAGSKGIAKALLEFGEPKQTILEHQIEWLSRNNAAIIIPAGGDQDGVLAQAKNINGSGSNIYPLYSSQQRGTGGDLLLALSQRPELFTDSFIISNVDTLLEIDIRDFMKFHQERGAALTIALTQNVAMVDGSEVPNKDALFVDASDKVIFSKEASMNPITESEAERICTYRGSSTGLIAADRDFLSAINWRPEDGELSIYKDIATRAIMEDRMYAFNNGHKQFLDIGTPQALQYAKAHPELFNH